MKMPDLKMLMKMLSLLFMQRKELKNYKELVKMKEDDLTSFYHINYLFYTV